MTKRKETEDQSKMNVYFVCIALRGYCADYAIVGADSEAQAIQLLRDESDEYRILKSTAFQCKLLDVKHGVIETGCIM